MENKTRNINYPILAFVIIQILFVILVVTSIKSLFKEEKINPDDFSRQPSISIEKLNSKVSVLGSNAVSNIEHDLLKIVEKNSTSIDFTSAKAVLRDESIHTHFFETENLGEVNFIVDIPEFEQTYQIFYEYSPDENNSYLEPDDRIIILCVEPSEVKYQDFNCKDLYSQGTRNFIVQKYLNFADFDKFYAEIVDEDIDRINIHLFYREETDGKDYINQTKAMVKSFGVSPELFTYEIVQSEIPTHHSMEDY